MKIDLDIKEYADFSYAGFSALINKNIFFQEL